MANEFPASQLLVSRAVEQYAAIAKSVKNLAEHTSTQMAAGNYAANLVVDLWERLKTSNAQLATIAATPGIGDKAKEEYGDPEFDVAASHTQIMTAIGNVTSHIETAVPKSNDYLLVAQFGASALTFRQFTPTETATLQGLLDTLAGTII